MPERDHEITQAEGKQQLIKYTLFMVDPAWRRLPENERDSGRASFVHAVERFTKTIRTYSYSTLGLKSQGELLFWQIADSPETLQNAISELLRTDLGRYLDVAYWMLGLVRPSQYVRRQSSQDQALSQPDRLKYLIVYPFTKTIEWYLLSREARQGMMNEHIRAGHQYPSVRQVLAHSFGLDDQEFIVTYETNELHDFQELVMTLRHTEARRYTSRDTPIILGIHRSLEEALALLG